MKTALILMMLLAASVLHAKEESMSVSPAVITLRGEAGQSTTQTLTFTNGTSLALAFEMRAQDGIIRDGKRHFVEPGTLPGSIAATAVFSPNVFTVEPGRSIPIQVTVTIPARTSVRAIAVMCQGTTKLASGPLRMTASVGTLLTFALTGDVIAAEASALIVQAPTASSNFVASHQVANSGTEPVVATGMLAILNAEGTLSGKQSIPSWRMLPGETTDVRVEYGGLLPAGHYRAMVTYDLTDKTLTTSAEFDVR